MTSQAQSDNFDQRDPDQQLSSLSVANSPQPLRGLSSGAIESRSNIALDGADSGDIFDGDQCPNRILFADTVGDSQNDKGNTDVEKSRTENEVQGGNLAKTEVEDAAASQKYRQKAQELAQQAWESHLNANDSIITDLFAGQLQSTIQCLQCNHR
jgi:hypothetical protein